MFLHEAAPQERLQVASTKASFGTGTLMVRCCNLKWVRTGTDFLVTMAKSLLFAKYWQWPGKLITVTKSRVLSPVFGDKLQCVKAWCSEGEWWL